MKRTHRLQGKPAGAPEAAHRRAAVQAKVSKAKQQLLAEFGEQVGHDLQLLRLALNEAEALAWSTPFPHLFFPALALEKVQRAIHWHRRQRALRAVSAELSFAE